MTDYENGKSDDVQRWTGKRKADLVLQILSGKITVAEACRKHSLTPSEVEEWMEEGTKAMENALKARPLNEEEALQKQVKDLQAKVGELVLQNEALKKLQALRNSGRLK